MNVAFIPVRGGSKSIRMKNIKKIGGQPLVYWTMKAAAECRNIDKVYVATDNERIREVVESFRMPKVRVIERSVESATDTASTELVMLEFADKYDFDNIVLIQATSPLLTSHDLDGGLELFHKDNIDSVLSVVEQKRFVWKYLNEKVVEPINYDVYLRPRRQEFSGFLVENGAFYITTKENLIKSKNRLSGRIGAYEMEPVTYFELDEPSDWEIIEQQLIRREASNNVGQHNFSEYRMLLTDCDGCLTDGGMYYSENGDEMKKFNTKDGNAFHILKEHGFITGIITGENRELNRRRAKKLQLDEMISGSKDKAADIHLLCKKYKLNPDEIIYIGDDLNDIDAMHLVGFSCAPADACEAVKNIADYVAARKGGEGVVREIVDLIVGHAL